MKIKTSPDFSNIKDWTAAARYISSMFLEVVSILNGGLNFSENANITFASVNFVATNSEIRVPHSLGRTPTGYALAGQSVAMRIYDGLTANDSKNIYIKSDALGSATVMIF